MSPASRRFTPRLRLGAVPAIGPTMPRNQVILGDCIEVLAGLPADSVQLVLTDPPYACRYRSRDGETLRNDDNTAWLKPAFAKIARVMERRALCVSFYGWHVADEFLAAWRAAGLRPVGHLVFPKRYSSSARLFECRHEQAYVLAKCEPRKPYVPIADVLPWAYTGNVLHPTQKPVEALAPIISALTVPGDLVFDPFCGSGSTLAAAKGLNRAWLGIDVEARHVATARKRLA